MKNMKNEKITKEILIKIVDFIVKEYHEFPTKEPGLWLGEKVNIFLNILSFERDRKVYTFSEAGKKWLDFIYENEDEVIKKIKNKCICNKDISEVTKMADELCEYIYIYKKEILEIISLISKNENIPIACTDYEDGEYLNSSFTLNVELDLLNLALLTKISTNENEIVVDRYEFKNEEEIVNFFDYISFDDLVYVENKYIEAYEKEIG